MSQEQPPAAVEDDGALAWRSELSLRLLKAQFFVFLIGAILVLHSVSAGRNLTLVAALLLGAAATVGVAALTGRPGGVARAWLLVTPMVAGSISGYALVGVLSGPGVCLTVSLMLAGLLLGSRAMIVLIAVSALAVAAVGWAMVHGVLTPPMAADVSMENGRVWVRTLAITFMSVALFGGLMTAVVARIESALRLARSETLRREQAERARAEAELGALESKQLETIGRLAAGVAHDFNNNLTAIMGSAELLKLDLADRPEQLELAEGVLQASQRASELTRQLLAYSRKAQMLLAPTDLHRVIDEAVSLLRRSIDPNVSVVTKLEAASATIGADTALLESALLNLLVNARDAMPQGGTLTVATSSVVLPPDGDEGPSGPCLLLEIADTGRGIERELLPHIFDPFFTTKPIGKGTGLGLAAVSGTVKGHGGRIEVESELGRGSRFRVYLPCTSAQGVATRSPGNDVVHGSGEILLVEDDAMVSVTAISTLRSFGYAVTHAVDGKAALELVRAHPQRFALVLLDLRMPGLSGEATFDALRELDGSLRVLIWSGYGADQDVTAMLKRGAVGFVQKPYRVPELSRKIAEALR